MGLRSILAALALSVMACAAPAQDFSGPRDEAGDKLGELVAPPGGKAYRSSWHGTWEGFIEVTVTPDGAAVLRSSWHKEPVTLRPGDLTGFEAELARASAADFHHPHSYNCLDECSYFFLAVARDGQRQHGQVYPGPLTEAVNELAQLADLRAGGRPFAAPAPWWTRQGLARQAPRLAGPQAVACADGDAACTNGVWNRLRTGLGLVDDLAPTSFTQLEQRSYRLVTVPPVGTPRVAALTLFDNPRTENCPPRPGVIYISCPSVIDAARIAADGHRFRRASLKRARAFEDALFAAGFSDLAAGPGAPCPEGEGWVLEAAVGDRYRAVTGSSCDPRGLQSVLDAIRHLAGEDRRRTN